MAFAPAIGLMQSPENITARLFFIFHKRSVTFYIIGRIYDLSIPLVNYKTLFLSFPRRRESRPTDKTWIPAFARMTDGLVLKFVIIKKKSRSGLESDSIIYDRCLWTFRQYFLVELYRHPSGPPFHMRARCCAVGSAPILFGVA